MSVINRKLRSFKPLAFTVNLDAIGKTSADVVDVICIIKRSVTDPDSEALRITKMVDGNTIDVNNKVLIPWNFDEYTGFLVGVTYKLGVFCKFNGDPQADEDVKHVFDLKILQDMSHDE